MKRRVLLGFILGYIVNSLVAQTDRQLGEQRVRSPFVSVTSGGVVPGGGLSTHYGSFGVVGFRAGFKAESNRCLYGQAASWSGADVQVDGLLSDLLTPQGQIIDNEGDVAALTITGRGGQFGIGMGWIFPTGWSNPNSGWMLCLETGSLHHRVHFDYTDNKIGALEGDRSKGYDRMRWGPYAGVWAGYWLMSTNQRLNAFLGLEACMASTWRLRSVNFDTLEENLVRANERWWGLRCGWVFHLYRRSAKEYWY